MKIFHLKAEFKIAMYNLFLEYKDIKKKMYKILHQ